MGFKILIYCFSLNGLAIRICRKNYKETKITDVQKIRKRERKVACLFWSSVARDIFTVKLYQNIRHCKNLIAQSSLFAALLYCNTSHRCCTYMSQDKGQKYLGRSSPSFAETTFATHEPAACERLNGAEPEPVAHVQSSVASKHLK